MVRLYNICASAASNSSQMLPKHEMHKVSYLPIRRTAINALLAIFALVACYKLNHALKGSSHAT